MNPLAQDFSEAAAAFCGALLVFFLNQSPQAFNVQAYREETKDAH